MIVGISVQWAGGYWNPIYRVLLMVVLLPLLPESAAIAADLVTLIPKVRSGVVAMGVVIRNGRQVKTEFLGTGFVVPDGTRIVTNYHVYRSIEKVIGSQKRGRMAAFSGRGNSARVHDLRLVRTDPVHDLALLELRTGSLPPLRLAGPVMVPEGTPVAFTGFPIGIVLGLYPVTHRGMVSAITPIVIPAESAKRLTPEQVRRIRNGRFDVYQLDGTAYPGNSGSPVYEVDSGRVIGVVNSVFIRGSKEAALEKPSGITYAIPVEYVHRLLHQKR